MDSTTEPPSQRWLVVLGVGAVVYAMWDRRLVASEAAIPA